MKKQKNTESITKLAFLRVKRTFSRKSLLLVLLSFSILVSLAIALFLPESLILTIPLLITPSVFAFQAINTILESAIEKDGAGFFMMFKMYYTKFFFGCYKLLKAFLKALLVTLIISFISGLIYNLINPSFMNDLEAMLKDVKPDQIEKVIADFLLNDESYQKFILLSTLVSFLAGTMMFIHSSQIDGFKYYFNLLSKTPLFAVDLNTTHKAVFKRIKKPFYKDYYKALWFVPIFMIVGFVGGLILGIEVFEMNIDSLIVLGLFGMFILSFMFIPYYFDVTLLIFKKYHEEYVNEFINLSIKTLEELKKTNQINGEKEKEIIDFLNKQSPGSKDVELPPLKHFMF